MSGSLFCLLMVYNKSRKSPGVLFLSFLKKAALLESWSFIGRKRERIKISDRYNECPSFWMGKSFAFLQTDVNQRIIWIINFCHHILEHKGTVAVLWHVTGRTRHSMFFFLHFDSEQMYSGVWYIRIARQVLEQQEIMGWLSGYKKQLLQRL